MNNNYIEKFLIYIEKDIKKLENGLKEQILAIINKECTFSIELSFFKENVNKHCFNYISSENNISITEILRERLELIKKIFITHFELENITVISFKNHIHYNFPKKIELFYLLYYEIFKQKIHSSDEVRNIFRNILEEWKLSFEQKKFPVLIKVIFPRINTKDEIIINEEFHIERPHDHKHLKNFNEIHTFEIENLLIYKTKLSFNYYEGFGGAFENFFHSNWEKFDDEWWQDIVKKIYEISSSFYLIGIDFRQEDEKIIASLPWWLNLEEREDAKNLERPINIYAYIIPIEKYNEFREIYRFVKESSIFIDEKYEIIRSRFSQFYNRKSYSDQDKILDGFIIFEHLFGKNGNEDMIFRISFNGAFFLSDNEADFLKIFRFLKKMYNIRSKIIHGVEWSQILKEYIYNDKEFRNPLRLIKKFKKYINTSLRKLINLKLENPEFLQDINKYSDQFNKIRKSSCFKELGDYYGNIKEYSEALKMYKEALKTAKELDDQKKVKKYEKSIQEIYEKNKNTLMYFDELEKVKEELQILIEYNPKKSNDAKYTKVKMDILKKNNNDNKNNNDIKLKIDGKDIMNLLGIPQSKKVGEIKNDINERVLSGLLRNEREELLEYIRNKKYLENNKIK